MAKSKKSKRYIEAIIAALVLVILIVLYLNTEMPEETGVLKCNGVNITAGVYKSYIYECTHDYFTNGGYTSYSDEEYLLHKEEFWSTAVNGELPLEIIRKDVLEHIKYYAYYTIECKNNNVILDGIDLQELKAYVETEFKDIDTEMLLGVEKEDYLSYLADIAKFNRYTDGQIITTNVTQKDIDEMYNLLKEGNPDITVEQAKIEAQREIYYNKVESYLNANSDKYEVEILDEEVYDSIKIPNIFIK